MLVSVGAWAETLRYVGEGDNWSDPNSWVIDKNGKPAGKVPYDNDGVVIPNGKIVTYGSDGRVVSVVVEAGATLKSNNGIKINWGNAGGYLEVNGTVVMSGELNVSRIIVGSNGVLDVKGNVQVNYGNSGAGFENNGQVNVTGSLNSGGLKVGSGASLVVGGGLTVNYGNSGQVFESAGSVEVGGDMNCYSVTLKTGSDLSVGGGVSINYGNSGGVLSMESGTSVEIGGSFKTGDITIQIEEDGKVKDIEIVIDFADNSVAYDKDKTTNIINALIAAGAYHRIETTSWIGYSSDWFLGSNWSGGVVPTKYHKVTISLANKKVAPVIDGGMVAYARMVTIDAGALTINPGNALYVSDKIFVDNANKTTAALNINHRFDKMSSLYAGGVCVKNSSSDYTKVNVSVDLQKGRYTYAGSYTKEGTISMSGGALLFKTYDIYSDSYVTASSFGANYTDAGEIGVGGSLNETWNLKQVGSVLSSGNFKINVPNVKDSDGSLRWNLVSNPFSFAYPLSDISCSKEDNVDPVIWFYGLNSAGNAFAFTTYSIATHVGVNNGKGVSESATYMAPMQAFFVRPNGNGAGNLSLNSAGVRDLPSKSSLKSERVVNDVLRLVLESDGREPDEMALVFRDGGAMDCVFGDAEKMSINASANQIYGVKSSKRLAIPFYPTCDEVGDEEITIGFSLPSNVKYGTIRATNVEEFMSDVDVYLVDKVNNEVVDLREVDEYQFEDIPGVCIDDRFSISLKSLNVSEEEQEDEIATGVFVAGVDEKLGVSCVGDGNVRIALSEDANDGAYAVVYDVYGRVLARRALVRGVNNIRVNGRGVFVVEAVAGGVSKKVKVRSL